MSDSYATRCIDKSTIFPCVYLSIHYSIDWNTVITNYGSSSIKGH